MESTPLQESEGRAVCQVLAMVLERLVDASSNVGQDDAQVTKFHALRAPAIGICQYLERCVNKTDSKYISSLLPCPNFASYLPIRYTELTSMHLAPVSVSSSH
jgi:hypothetical protein